MSFRQSQLLVFLSQVGVLAMCLLTFFRFLQFKKSICGRMVKFGVQGLEPK